MLCNPPVVSSYNNSWWNRHCVCHWNFRKSETSGWAGFKYSVRWQSFPTCCYHTPRLTPLVSMETPEERKDDSRTGMFVMERQVTLVCMSMTTWFILVKVNVIEWLYSITEYVMHNLIFKLNSKQCQCIFPIVVNNLCWISISTLLQTP